MLEVQPIWPFIQPHKPVFWVAGLLALVLMAVTLASYRGIRGATWPRLATLALLRLAALALAFLAFIRPTMVRTDTESPPGQLTILLDSSRSMATADEADGTKRFDKALAHLRAAKPILERLKTEANVETRLFKFADGVETLDLDNPGGPEGKLTDLGGAMRVVLDKSEDMTDPRGLLVLGDGIETGARRFPARAQAGSWRRARSPVSTFSYGGPAADTGRRDIALTEIKVEPVPRVPHGGEMRVIVDIDYPGFASTRARFKLKLNGAEVEATAGNVGGGRQGNPRGEVVLPQGETSARVEIRHKPVQPLGEVGVEVTVGHPDNGLPFPGEQTAANNTITTFAHVAKEGVSVLVLDKPRAFEPQSIIDTLARDQVISVYPVWLRGNGPAGRDLLELDQRNYDVVIIGDITPQQLEAASPGAAKKIEEMVALKGAGLLLLGGYAAFGNGGWDATALKPAMPLQMGPGAPSEKFVRMKPTAAGLRICSYFMALGAGEDESRRAWDSLKELEGYSKLGRPDNNATVLATVENDEPLLVAKLSHGKGRVLAFGGDTTHRWIRDRDSRKLHERFWLRLTRWLAHQDTVAGSAYLTLQTRRVPVLPERGPAFLAGIRTNQGLPVPKADLKIILIGPDGKAVGPGGKPVEGPPLPLAFQRKDEEAQGAVDPGLLTRPGLYTLVLEASGQLPDGEKVQDKVEAKFQVFEDDRELLKLGTDLKFLEGLARDGGGVARRGDDLGEFLRSLLTRASDRTRKVVERLPDWSADSFSPFLVLFLATFIGILLMEWTLRRLWGLL
jgi:uncharacterized membrane protein